MEKIKNIELMTFFGNVVKGLQAEGYKLRACCPGSPSSVWGNPDSEFADIPDDPTIEDLGSALNLMEAAEMGCLLALHPQGALGKDGKPYEHAYHSFYQGSASEFFYDGCGCNDSFCQNVWDIISERGNQIKEEPAKTAVAFFASTDTR